MLSTSSGLYIAEVVKENRFRVLGARRVEEGAAWLSESHYQTELLMLSEDVKKVRFLRVGEGKGRLGKLNGSPLTN